MELVKASQETVLEDSLNLYILELLDANSYYDNDVPEVCIYCLLSLLLH